MLSCLDGMLLLVWESRTESARFHAIRKMRKNCQDNSCKREDVETGKHDSRCERCSGMHSVPPLKYGQRCILNTMSCPAGNFILRSLNFPTLNYTVIEHEMQGKIRRNTSISPQHGVCRWWCGRRFDVLFSKLPANRPCRLTNKCRPRMGVFT